MWTASAATIGDPAAKALAIKAILLKVAALGGGAYGLQYIANSDWVKLLALQTNAPINIIDGLAYMESLPVVGILPFESLRTMLVNYWFMT
jgi:hypothetical protein